ncbi:helix-turn-helix domain-containing protein [Streptomyces sp. NPDC052023]|uniref:AraC-like ligand-binding domain-containing protein n=1 Tax=Streptomyces sp. NPDC052023 TaxID=3365681 RepID=UPI0037D6833C
MSLIASTDAVPDAEKLSYWNQLVTRAFVPVNVTALSGAPFHGRIATDSLGCLRLSTVEADPERVVRSRRLIDREGGQGGSVMITQQVAGTAVIEQDDRQARLTPGSLVVCDTARPYLLDSADRSTRRVFQLPRRALHVAQDDLDVITATELRSDSGVGALLPPFLASLARTAPQCAKGVGELLAGNVADLLTTLVAERTEPRHADPDSARRALAQRIRHFIDQNLGDSELAPEAIAAAHHISVRYLHKIFARDGTTVGRWIQRRRLEECSRELARRGSVSPTVSAVAMRWGFVNPAHFSRSFRAAYGMSPSEWRALRAPQESCV